MAAQLYKTASGRLFHAGSVAIITVGLPARGKTHVSRSLCRYLRWLGVSTRVFSVGNYRRERMGSIPNNWFDPQNVDAHNVREKIADECLDDLIHWLDQGEGQVGIYDGNNVTEDRRREIYTKLTAHNINTLFIESICTKPEIVYANIRSVKISSPDYVGWDPEEAVKDYTHRIERLEQNYETISDTTLPFVKMLDVGERIIVNGVVGYLQSRIVYYLMNLHIRPRKIYFARTGKTLNDASYKDDGELSPEGHEYAMKLKNFLLAYRAQGSAAEDQGRSLMVWTSTRRKAKQTAIPFMNEGIAVKHHSVLTQMNPGEADGLTMEQLKKKFPEEVKRARQDPYRHRYPRAESYHDLAVRLEAIIMELEREKNDVLIIGHETVLKCLYAYLFDRPESDIPAISIPYSFLVEITPSAYGCKESRMRITG
ncbi:6-phosphofructo-2-kinase-domain-containing protein [Dichotomocladium elegans]|nr:6-phosphofructo-2-kinase-domain-containing protein [Dichotomocladium elegans]